jgi:(E)-4-hydroxy-3-methyl-but-2-enyl pyrophosphate reductase
MNRISLSYELLEHDMDVLVPKRTGFCPGVKLAEQKLNQLKKTKNQPIYILGNLIHNRNYTQHLANQDIFTVESIDDIPPESVVVIRTHGIPRDLEKKLWNMFSVLDCTCVKVKKIQNIILEYSEKGYFTVITGKKEHPEVKGLKSYAAKYLIVESFENIKDNLQKIPAGKILLISQTTADRSLFDGTLSILKRFPKEYKVTAYDSICDITISKENEALELQKNADCSFVIGDEISSNAKRLYNTLYSNGEVYFIHSVSDLREMHLPFDKWNAVMVVSSASTPDYIENEVISFLENIE